MAINGEILNDVLADTNAVSTSEANFRTGLEDTIRQVNTTQIHMDAERVINMTGPISATTGTYQLNDSGEYTLTLATTQNANSVNSAAIFDTSITTAKIANSNVTNEKIAGGTITQDKISSSAKKTLRILDVGGAVLFQGSVLEL